MPEIDHQPYLFKKETRNQALERVSIECGLPLEHKAVGMIVDSQTSEELAITALADKMSEAEDLKSRLELSRSDELTGLLLRRPFTEEAEAVFAEIDKNLDSQDNSGPNAALIIMIDIEAMHHINNRYGHDAGDRAITNTANIMKKTAEFMVDMTRSSDRRDEPREGAELGRPKDVLGRRGGDEFVMVLPFTETEKNTRGGVAERVTARMNDSLGAPYINWKHTFYSRDKKLEQLIEEADPKTGKTRLERIARTGRKIGRVAMGRYSL